MQSFSDSNFYKDLTVLKGSLSQLLNDPVGFYPVPDSWYIVLTDIKNSTAAIADGKHELVNLIATGSIVAALNIVQPKQLEIPFFFGGDGATLLVPGEVLEDCLAALYEHRTNTLRSFQLELRVGYLSVKEIYGEHQQLALAKVKLTRYLNIPVILGTGLRYAEDKIKTPSVKDQDDAADSVVGSSLDLTGMECRWDRIKPPYQSGEVVSLLVDAASDHLQPQVFAKVMDHLETIYGPINSRNPISVKRLKIATGINKIKAEMRVKFGENDYAYLLKNWIFTLVGKVFYGREKSSRRYLENLVLLSDTLVLDGRINTVISGTREQCHQLVAVLNTMEQADEIIFGWHCSPESVMSCFVRNRVDQHIHFVDGSEGGYTQAAKMLKGKLIELR
jgi:hypothetical protein